MKFFTSDNLELIEDELKEENQIMSKVIEEYKRFTSDDKMMQAYADREVFLVVQKMMLSRERKDGIEEGIKKENINIELIKKITGLNIDEINRL